MPSGSRASIATGALLAGCAAIATWAGAAAFATFTGTLGGCGSSGHAADDAPGVVLDAAAADASAADSGSLGPGTGDGLPDLQPYPSQMTRTMITSESFDAGSCEVVEGCVGAAGQRTLLRFNTVSVNFGTADLALGPTPPAGQSNAIFQWSACHMHHHVIDYAAFELVSATSDTVISARKQAFCLEDDEPIAPPAGGYVPYNCMNQGISRGYADVYGMGLDCQWIDITGVAAGQYTLRVTLNPSHTLPESNYDNNVFTLGVTIPPQ